MMRIILPLLVASLSFSIGSTAVFAQTNSIRLPAPAQSTGPSPNVYSGKTTYIPDANAGHRLREVTTNSPSTNPSFTPHWRATKGPVGGSSTNGGSITEKYNQIGQQLGDVIRNSSVTPTTGNQSVAVSPNDAAPVNPDEAKTRTPAPETPNTENVSKELSGSDMVKMVDELDRGQTENRPSVEERSLENYSSEELMKMVDELPPSTSKPVKKPELSKVRAQRELGDLSDGIGSMIERADNVIADMDRDGTSDEAMINCRETMKNELPRMMKQIQKTIGDSFTYVVDPDPVGQVKNQGDIARDFNSSFQKVMASNATLQRATDNEEARPVMQKLVTNLRINKNVVDKMLQFYKTDPPSDAPTDQSPK